MKYFNIEIDGSQQFDEAYNIYIIKVNHINKGCHYYIGQTGDRNYKTARPAFRRLAGHLSDSGSSTQNQVYKKIAKNILGLEFDNKQAFHGDVKEKVSEYLKKSKIIMTVFPIIHFNNKITNDEHRKNIKYIESIENNLINKMKKKYSDNKVLNSRYKKDDSNNDEINKIVEEIMELAKV